jgi:hypothetical protein
MLSGAQFEACWRKRARDEARQKRNQHSLRSWDTFAAMADFRSIAAEILGKDRVVARPFIYPWPSTRICTAAHGIFGARFLPPDSI